MRSQIDEWGGQRGFSVRRFHHVPDLQRRTEGRQIGSGDLTIESVRTLGKPEPHGARRSCFLERNSVVKHSEALYHALETIFELPETENLQPATYNQTEIHEPHEKLQKPTTKNLGYSEIEIRCTYDLHVKYRSTESRGYVRVLPPSTNPYWDTARPYTGIFLSATFEFP